MGFCPSGLLSQWAFVRSPRQQKEIDSGLVQGKNDSSGHLFVCLVQMCLQYCAQCDDLVTLELRAVVKYLSFSKDTDS